MTRSRFVIMILTAVLILMITYVPVSAESFFEYYFIPGETESPESETKEEVGNFFDVLPEEIRSRLPQEMLSNDLSQIADGAEELTDFSYIWQNLVEAIKDILFPSLRSAAAVFGLILLSGVFRALRNTLVDTGITELAGTVISAGIAIALISTELTSISVIEDFKNIICGLMNGMVPLLGVVYAATGNGGTAAVQSGGVMMLVTLCQNLFSTVLMPAIRICLILSTAGAVFPEIGIKHVTTAFRNIATWVMVASVTLFSFMLGLQNTIAQSADSFGARSIKFAVGNLVPIIGGAVSDSLGTVGGSLAVLKSAGGAAAIVIVIILLVPTIATLVIHRLTIFLCKSTAGILGCTGEESLLGDIGSVASMMLAFAAAMSVSFIYALTLFTGSSLAIAG